MKKFCYVIFAIIIMFAFAQIVIATPALDEDFIFDAEPGTITKYIGAGGDVEIPSTIIRIEPIEMSTFDFTTSNKTYVNLSDNIVAYGEINGAKTEDYYINLTTERLIIPSNYKIEAYSVDGGNKWKTNYYSDTVEKLLNKGMTLALTDAYDKKAKKPANNAIVVKFPKIDKRPKAPKLTINYLIEEEVSRWVLSAKNGSTAVYEGIEITTSYEGSKSPHEKSWRKMNSKGESVFPHNMSEKIDNNGNTKYIAVKTLYFIRYAAKENGANYTPKSKTAKITAVNELQPPKYKVNTKKGTIKVKSGTCIQLGNDLPIKYTSATEVDVSNYSGSIMIWIAATAKKLASYHQWINIK